MAQRKPKKVFVQFAIALVVALILGAGAVVVGLSIITNVSVEADKKAKEAEAAKKQAEEEAARLRQQQQKVVKITYKTVEAVADIVPGQPITKDMVTLVESEMPPPSGAVTQLSQAVGKMVKSPIIAGEPVMQTKLLDGDGFITVNGGMRAITIKTDSIGGLNGALSPGVHVDILVTITNNDNTVSKTLLQDIQVISVGNSSDAGGAGGPGGRGASAGSRAGNAVTVAVTPKQAELLALANKLGSFHLTLRNFTDKNKNKLAGADMTELLTGVTPGQFPKTLPPPPEPAAGSFQNVNFSNPDGANLPAPDANSATSKFSMTVYKGPASETVDFAQ